MNKPRTTTPTDRDVDREPRLSNTAIAIILWGDLLVLGAVAVILAIRYG